MAAAVAPTPIAANVNVFPFRAIVYVRAVLTNGLNHRGTGFFVSEHVVATAAHNLVIQNAQVQRVEILVGLDGSPELAKTFTAQSWHPSPSFSLGSPATDFGVVIVEPEVGAATGFFGMRSIADGEIGGLAVDVDGYPDPSFSQTAVQTQLDRNSSTSRVLGYSGATRRGQSGGPVWQAAGAVQAVGIHGYEDSDVDLGVRITPAVFDWIRNHT